MSLLQLPPETLIQIFDYVGSSYFCSDLSRLTVCTATLTVFSVRGIKSSSGQRQHRSLDLNLKGFEDWDSIPLPQHDSRAVNVLDVSTWNGVHGRAVRAAWTTELNNDLLYLGTIIKKSRRLRILRIQATSELHPLLRLPERRDYLFLSAIRAFLSASNLTSLELDLCGTRLILHQSQEDGEGSHVCASIAALLTTLRRLRLRMRSICADVLKTRQHSTNLRLNEILINLSLSNESPLTTSAAHAICCGSPAGGFLQLKADMEKQAQVLVAQMATPKIVRILTHALPSIEMRAFNVLAGRNVTLSEGAEWDDDGEAIEESEISDLS